jgi:hypothetical protein
VKDGCPVWVKLGPLGQSMTVCHSVGDHEVALILASGALEAAVEGEDVYERVRDPEL